MQGNKGGKSYKKNLEIYISMCVGALNELFSTQLNRVGMTKKNPYNT
jgi:hypothetical protein